MPTNLDSSALPEPKHQFHLWEIILVAVIILIAVLFFVFRLPEGGTTSEPLNSEANLGDLNKPVEDSLSAEERSAALEQLNKPVEDSLSAEERSAALEQLNN